MSRYRPGPRRGLRFVKAWGDSPFYEQESQVINVGGKKYPGLTEVVRSGLFFYTFSNENCILDSLEHYIGKAVDTDPILLQGGLELWEILAYHWYYHEGAELADELDDNECMEAIAVKIKYIRPRPDILQRLLDSWDTRKFEYGSLDDPWSKGVLEILGLSLIHI